MIGVVPNSPDFNHPADRRRYLFYFNDRKINYESARFDVKYEMLYVSIGGDLELWSQYKRKGPGKLTKVIFDLSDFYFDVSRFENFLRSSFHFLSGRTSKFRLSYAGTLIRMIDNSDVVLCGSEEQKKCLDVMHKNVVVMRDYFEDDLKVKKSDYALSNKNEINVLWEGLSHGNEKIFQMLREILSKVKGFKVNLHLVSDPSMCRLGGKLVCRSTPSVIANIFSDTDIRTYFYSWCTATFSAIAASCDFALIPIPDDAVMRNKPENKLLLLWTIGLPVITTDTPAYKRVMNSSGILASCAKLDDWGKVIEDLALSIDKRKDHMKNANKYLVQHCSKISIENVWDKVFDVQC